MLESPLLLPVILGLILHIVLPSMCWYLRIYCIRLRGLNMWPVRDGCAAEDNARSVLAHVILAT